MISRRDRFQADNISGSVNFPSSRSAPGSFSERFRSSAVKSRTSSAKLKSRYRDSSHNHEVRSARVYRLPPRIAPISQHAENRKAVFRRKMSKYSYSAISRLPISVNWINSPSVIFRVSRVRISRISSERSFTVSLKRRHIEPIAHQNGRLIAKLALTEAGCGEDRRYR